MAHYKLLHMTTFHLCKHIPDKLRKSENMCPKALTGPRDDQQTGFTLGFICLSCLNLLGWMLFF
jgi:hypothetical protein